MNFVHFLFGLGEQAAENEGLTGSSRRLTKANSLELKRKMHYFSKF